MTDTVASLFSHFPPKPRKEQEIVTNWDSETDHPMVSILCATYQHRDYLQNALDSFLMQKTDFRYEIIVRDDASTDGTREILKDYASRYPNIIRAVYEENNQYQLGIYPFPKLISMAKGRYIAVCEGDDFWTDDKKLSKQVEFLENNIEFAITYHDAIVIDQENQIKQESMLGDAGKVDYSAEKLIFSGVLPTATRCFRNLVQELPDEYNYVKAGDIFSASLLANYGGAKYLDCVLPSVYRRHEGGIWAGISAHKRRIMLAETFYWLSIYYKRIGKRNISAKMAVAAIRQLSLLLNLRVSDVIKYSFKMILTIMKSKSHL